MQLAHFDKIENHDRAEQKELVFSVASTNSFTNIKQYLLYVFCLCECVCEGI